MKKLSVIEKFTNSKIFKEIEEQEHELLLEKRDRSTRIITTLEAEKTEKIKELRAALSESEAKLNAARKAFHDAELEYNKAKSVLSGTSNHFDRLIDNQKAILLDSYDPVIDQAIEFFINKLAVLRRPGVINSQAMGFTNNLIDLTKNTSTITNRPAVLSAIAYCQAAIRELEAMKLLPAIDPLWLESLRAGIPNIDDYTEIDGRRSMEKCQQGFVDFSLNPNLENKVNRLHYIADGLLHGRKAAENNQKARKEQRARA